MTATLRYFIESLLLVVAALLPIVNPFGGAPMFLAMTADVTPDVRAELARKIAINAFILIVASLFVGTYVLDFFGLSVPIVQVAGGILVCAAGWELLRAEQLLKVEIVGESADIATRAFYPLTLPLTVGPGTISVAITIGAHHTQNVRSLLLEGTADVFGALVVAVTVFVCYRYADRLLRKLGRTGTSVLIRLSAFILLCVGVQIFWTGASTLLSTVVTPGALPAPASR
ncbi:MAG TPA: MarC family protein [Casimicrobiaceae bacterium]|nr:MarC family protein [Casimicrobiaceae bacterium]